MATNAATPWLTEPNNITMILRIERSVRQGIMVSDKEEVIRAADVNADYTVRPDRAEIVRQLRTLAKTVQK
jgi:hypothetical protein